MSLRVLPHDGQVPRSWYQVGYSADIAPGDVRPLTAFGHELVAFRSEGGVLAVLDAFCPHLGAHLGHGGTVSGEAIVCPYHAWEWGTDGRHVRVPYAEGAPLRCEVPAWPVDERNGVVWVWFDPAGGAPEWTIPDLPEWADGSVHDPFPHLVSSWSHQPIHPQFVVENAVDAAHQKYVHGSTDVSEIVDFSARGPFFFTRQAVVFGKGKGTTWLTPDGERLAHLDVETWGMGAAIARFSGTDDAVHLQTQTPNGDGTYEMRTTVYVRRGEGEDEPSERARRRVAYEFRQVENDLAIWKHQTYVERPLLTAGERDAFRAFRRWSQQFYAS